MVKYPKIGRIQIDPAAKLRGKHYLSDEEIVSLLSDDVVIEEKIDGKLTQYEVEHYTVFGEWMKRKHTVEYHALPGWLIGFDVFDHETGRFLDYVERDRILKLGNVPVIKWLFIGEANLKFVKAAVTGKSAYGAERREGIIIKNYKKQIFGKIVDPAFEDSIDADGHHLNRPYVRNRLAI